MTVYSKLNSTYSEINPRDLCRARIGVLTGRVALRNVTHLCNVPNLTIREILDVIKHKQKSQVENHKDELIESHTHEQITRLVGNYLKCAQLSATYTTWELEHTMIDRFFDAGKFLAELLIHYGVPERTLRRWVKKVLNRLGIKTLKEAQCKIRDRDRGVRKEEVNNKILDLIQNKKC